MPRPPHHLANGRFTNPWPGADLHGFKDLLKWVLVDRIRNPPPPDPDPASLPRVIARIETTKQRNAPTKGQFSVLSASSVQSVLVKKTEATSSATWLGHSTVLLNLAGKWVLTDPVWSDRASPVSWAGPRRWVPPQLALEGLPPLDLIVQSHNHYDHLDRAAVERLATLQPGVPWLAPLGLGVLLRRFGVRQVQELDWWEETTINGIKVAATPAQHFSSRHFWDRNATLWCGYALESGNRRTYFAGDTGLHPEFKAIAERCGPFDLALIPVGAYEPRWFMQPVHMNPEDAVAAIGALARAHPESGVPHVIPIHWGTYKLTDEPMDEPPRRFAERWREAGFPADRLWLLAHGETRGLSE